MKAKSFEDLYYIYDPYFSKYMSKKQIGDFMYVDTKTCYANYIEERNTTAEPVTLALTARTFNRALRDLYPTLEIKHIGKDGKNAYIWVLKGE